MTSSFASSRVLAALRTTAALALFAGVLLASRPALACCSSVICPFCISSSSSCVCGPSEPVCNVFACDCNVQCGEYTPDVNSGVCYFNPTCDTTATQARFDEVDTSKDGKISLDEMRAWVGKLGEKFEQRIYRKDLPAKLQKAPLQEILPTLFSQLDKDRDGAISPGEFDKSLAPKQPAPPAPKKK